MLNAPVTRPAPARPLWDVSLTAELIGHVPAVANDELLERMVELMLRTRGVRSAAVTAQEQSAALAVRATVEADTPHDAVKDTAGLAGRCACYAGLHGLAVADARVAADRPPKGAA